MKDRKQFVPSYAHITQRFSEHIVELSCSDLGQTAANFIN